MRRIECIKNLRLESFELIEQLQQLYESTLSAMTGNDTQKIKTLVTEVLENKFFENNLNAMLLIELEEIERLSDQGEYAESRDKFVKRCGWIYSILFEHSSGSCDYFWINTILKKL